MIKVYKRIVSCIKNITKILGMMPVRANNDLSVNNNPSSRSFRDLERDIDNYTNNISVLNTSNNRNLNSELEDRDVLDVISNRAIVHMDVQQRNELTQIINDYDSTSNRSGNEIALRLGLQTGDGMRNLMTLEFENNLLEAAKDALSRVPEANNASASTDELKENQEKIKLNSIEINQEIEERKKISTYSTYMLFGAVGLVSGLLVGKPQVLKILEYVKSLATISPSPSIIINNSSSGQGPGNSIPMGVQDSNKTVIELFKVKGEWTPFHYEGAPSSFTDSIKEGIKTIFKRIFKKD
jgi:hypothetical protein